MSQEASASIGARGNETANPAPASTDNGRRLSNVDRFLNFMDQIVVGVLPQVKHDGPGYLNWEGAKLSLEILKSISDTTRVLAETDRIEAARWCQTEQAEIKRESGSSEITNNTSEVQESTVKDAEAPERRQLDMSSNVFSGLTGSVSWSELEQMSEDKLMELDEMLKRIVGNALDGTKSWRQIGQIIHEHLVQFGFRFAPYSGEYTNANWSRALDRNQLDLPRIREAIDCCADIHERRLSNEMLQVVRRLMEVRGFQI